MEVASLQQALQAAISGELPASRLQHQLDDLGAFRGTGRANGIARCSAMLCEALPKIGSPSVGEQLHEKLATHQLLLQCLGDAGALAHLHPTCLRLLFEDGQRLAAAIELRQLLSKQTPDAAASGPIHDAAVAAGRAAAAAVAGAGDRSALDLFFACPLTTVPQFLRQVAAAAAGLGTQPGRAAADEDVVAQLSKAVQAALGGAMQQRAQQQQWFGPALNAAIGGLSDPEWTAGEDARGALEALADAACRLFPLLGREASPHVQQEDALLALELTDRLLNAWAAAVAAAAPGQQRRQLHKAYSAAKGRLLAALLEQAQALGLGQPEGEAQLRRVEGLAEAHAAYAQLLDISRLTGDTEQLYRQMEQLVGDGLDPPFATFIFSRLLGEGRRAELLDLPSQFDAQLQQWLSDESGADGPARLQLRWLHELRTASYSAASSSLGRLVQAQQEGMPEGEAERLVALQRLSALVAAGGAEVGTA